MTEARQKAWTKGPWEVFRAVTGKHHTTAILLEGTNREIIAWSGFDASDFQKEVLANAHLIAAAPEMYDGLEHQIYRNHPYSETCDGCRNGALALAKARGGR